MTTIVVGDFELAELEAKVLKHFDFSKRKKTDAIPLTQVSFDEEKQIVHYEELVGEYQTSFLIIGYHGPNPSSLKETIALDIINNILGESRNARLTQALIEKPAKPIFNYIGSGQSTYKLGNAFYIQANFSSPDTKNAIEQVLAEIDKLLTTQPITEEEFHRAVKKMKVEFAETSETASGIAETIGEYLTVNGNLSHYTDYLPTLNSLTLTEVQDVANRYLNPDKAYTSVLLTNPK